MMLSRRVKKWRTADGLGEVGGGRGGVEVEGAGNRWGAQCIELRSRRRRYRNGTGEPSRLLAVNLI